MAGNDSSYPGDIAIGTAIAETRKIKCGMYALIEDPAGPIRRQVIRSVEDLVARMPGPRRGQGSRPHPGRARRPGDPHHLRRRRPPGRGARLDPGRGPSRVLLRGAHAVTARQRIGACLSMSGRFAPFGRQAALGLETWRSLTGDVELVLDDDRSDKD